jgi:hypothetical protein
LIIEASNADPDGKANAGKSFVVFGTADTDVIELSSVASGTGGFVIKQQHLCHPSFQIQRKLYLRYFYQ